MNALLLRPIWFLCAAIVFAGGILTSTFAAPWVADQGDGTYKNPVLFADYSDPDVIRVGDDFYMTASSFNCVPALPILHSRDLVNWKLVGYAVGPASGAFRHGPAWQRHLGAVHSVSRRLLLDLRRRSRLGHPHDSRQEPRRVRGNRCTWCRKARD